MEERYWEEEDPVPDSSGLIVGCPHCTGVLARCYINGSGVEKDTEKGFELTRVSAEAGSIQGFYALGMCYYSGIGVAQNFIEAIHYLKHCASHRHADSVYQLALMVLNGEGCVKKEGGAVRLLKLGARLGSVQCQV